MTYRIEGLAPAAFDSLFADDGRASSPRTARCASIADGSRAIPAGSALADAEPGEELILRQPCLARRRRRPIRTGLRHLRPQGRERPATYRRRGAAGVSPAARSACAASTPTACCSDALLAAAGRGRRDDPRAVRAARDRHHPRPQRRSWLLPGADRKELTMASLATARRRDTSIAVNDMAPISDDEAWAAFERRDRGWDGRIVGAVTTTGIYCKPSCPARRPKRENVDFFRTTAPRRGRPASAPACAASPTRSAARTRRSARRSALLDAGRGAALARRAGRGGRLFAAPFPAAVHARHRASRRPLMPGASAPGAPRRRLTEQERMTDAIYDAGYSGAEPLLCRRQGPARHDPVGLARRRPRRDDPLGDCSTPTSARCWSRRPTRAFAG